LAGLIAASEQPADRLCTASFTGRYPIELPEADPIGKHVLEGIERGVLLDEGEQGVLIDAIPVHAGSLDDVLPIPVPQPLSRS
jgi:amidophosphoribosyltransferase